MKNVLRDGWVLDHEVADIIDSENFLKRVMKVELQKYCCLVSYFKSFPPVWSESLPLLAGLPWESQTRALCVFAAVENDTRDFFPVWRENDLGELQQCAGTGRQPEKTRGSGLKKQCMFSSRGCMITDQEDLNISLTWFNFRQVCLWLGPWLPFP